MVRPCMHIYYIYCEANKLKYMCIYISVFLGHQRYIDREREIEIYIYIPKNMFKYILKYMHEWYARYAMRACTLIIYILWDYLIKCVYIRDQELVKIQVN